MDGTVWRVYCRISRAADGSTLGVERQEPACRRLVERYGGQVVEPAYVDNDLSAWSGEERPDFERLLDDTAQDARAGRRTGIVVWQADRLIRRWQEAGRILDFAREHGTLLATTGGPIDLETADGRSRFRQLADRAEFESDLKGERLRAMHQQLASSGQPNGGAARPFGFESDRVTVREDEKALILEATRRLLAGESMRMVVLDWKRRGVLGTGGAPFTHHSLKRVLCSGRVAGYRDHLGKLHPAAWPALVDRGDWEALRALLGKRKGQQPARRYLLTGFVVCGRCGAKLTAQPRAGGQRSYECKACFRIVRQAEPMEDYVRDQVLDALAGPGLELMGRRAAVPAWSPAVLAGRLEADSAKLGALETLKDDLDDYPAQVARIQARIELARRGLAQHAAAGVLADLPGTTTQLRAAWERWSLDKRRAVLAEVIARVVALPARRGARWDPDTVEIPPDGWRV